VLTAAHEHRGASFVEIYQNCNVFNDGAFAALKDADRKDHNQIRLTQGKPIVFGPDGERAVIALEDGSMQIVPTQEAGERLRDETAFWLVLTAERLPIEETARAEVVLQDGGLHVAGLVLNRLVPTDADGQYMAARRTQQEAYLEEAAARFAGRTLVRVDQLPTDVTSREHLHEVGRQLGRAL
jgi:anion-transporting  ArsA/GET3 family ATPase